MRKFATIILTSFASISSVAAQQPPMEQPPLPKQLRVELLIARIPEARAIALQPLLRDPEKCRGAQETILTMIGKKEAELVDWPVVTTKSGQQAMTENVHELLYASEFAPPPVTLSKTGAGPVLVEDPKAPGDPEKAKPKPEGPIELRILGAVPSVFEKRDVGVTFEFEPTISDDGVTVDLQLAPAHVTLLGWKKTTVENGPNEKIVVEQPEFQNLRIKTNITVRSGQPVLLGFHKLQDQPDRIEVFIVTATVLKGSRTSEAKSPQTPVKKRR